MIVFFAPLDTNCPRKSCVCQNFDLILPFYSFHDSNLLQFIYSHKRFISGQQDAREYKKKLKYASMITPFPICFLKWLFTCVFTCLGKNEKHCVHILWFITKIIVFVLNSLFMFCSKKKCIPTFLFCKFIVIYCRSGVGTTLKIIRAYI